MGPRKEGRRRREAGQEMFPTAVGLTATTQHGGSQQSQQSPSVAPALGQALRMAPRPHPCGCPCRADTVAVGATPNSRKHTE